MAAAMTPTSVWIERGSDGRHYFVRKKPSQPSRRQLLTEALLPRSARSFFSRDSRQNNHIRCVNPETPLIMPPPSSSTPVTAQDTGRSPTNPSSSQAQQLPQPVTMYLAPQSQDAPKPETREAMAQTYMKPQQHFLPYPHPSFFHIPAPYPAPGQGLPSLPPQPFMTHQPPFTAAPPPGPFLLQPPLPQIHQLQRQLPPTRGDSAVLRYKCEICGRFRSSRYHHTHPLLPGQLPGKTICRRCREEATDSEDESSADSYRSHNRRRHHSRARSWNASSIRNPRTRSRSRQERARSSTRKNLKEIAYDRYEGPPYSPQTSSTSTDDAHAHSRYARRYRRPDSPVAGFSKRFRKLKLVPQERVMYLESQDRYQLSPRYYDDSVGDKNDSSSFRR